jgi:hypothetical protein
MCTYSYPLQHSLCADSSILTIFSISSQESSTTVTRRCATETTDATTLAIEGSSGTASAVIFGTAGPVKGRDVCGNIGVGVGGLTVTYVSEMFRRLRGGRRCYMGIGEYVPALGAESR